MDLPKNEGASVAFRYQSRDIAMTASIRCRSCQPKYRRVRCGRLDRSLLGESWIKCRAPRLPRRLFVRT
jgi:hypothetical protein